MINLSPRLVSTLLILALPATGADKSNWSNLESLRRGDHVSVVQSDQKRIEGRFDRLTDQAITIQTDREVLIAKDQVLRVHRRPRVSRGMRALIGAGAGAAAGGALAGGIGNASSNEGFFSSAAAIGVTIASCAGVGAAIGALTGGGRKLVYQRVP